MVTLSSILAWKISWTEDTGRLQVTSTEVAKSRTQLRARAHEASPSNSCRVVDSSWLVLAIDWREDTEGSGLKSGKMGWSTSLLHTYVLL